MILKTKPFTLFLKLLHVFINKEIVIKKEIECNFEWYGSKYGGFYVCPDILNNKSVVYSFGAGEDISFDIALIDNHHCSVYGFDPTPKSINWIRAQKLPSDFYFQEYGLSKKSGIYDFYLPNNPEHVSGSLVVQRNIDILNKINVIMKSFDDIVKDLHHKQIDILKMDIEGSEFDVIDSILNSNIPINQILIEFHHRFFKDGRLKLKKTMNKLYLKGYEVFAFSSNFEEISFINKSVFTNQV